ncbi:molybdopterin-guanine dinucleotide biosynthesis protein B [Candidatus Bathyarchaeota archaeon]|nr:molybdopterin-guanine dinucleotide biosynthesis protein B [Candidatus Bathyarchaeota archaeon]
MSPPKAVAVVGFKGSGKTRVVEALVRELSKRGYRVGTVKHASGEHPLDTPGKDTWRHKEAGSYSTAILTSRGSAVYLNHPVELSEVIPLLGSVDYIILEGFKSLDRVARIIVPSAPGDIEPLSNGLEIAVVPLSDGEAPLYEKGTPVIPVSRVEELVDLILGKAFPILPGLDCGSCGYEGCRALAKAILAGKAIAEGCTVLSGGGVRLKVDGKPIPLNPFVRSFMGNVVLGMVRTLKGVGRPRGIEISVDVGELEDE